MCTLNDLFTWMDKICQGKYKATMRTVILTFINDKANIPYLVNVNVDSSGDFIFKDELDILADESYKNYWLNSRQDFYETLQ
ncbi:hypothetical protein LGK95_06855 [Clostridium algoriphilum]|uniref:hypothetical protein n=1 Tax=Clostridium algoriphilum TaxID=198347 RepID=UPI001CF562FC|nr:hypothetical protein [Clostridium algoriphilum]MCB2293238.1 hypothetical protein [Clostridium algoriphilum]